MKALAFILSAILPTTLLGAIGGPISGGTGGGLSSNQVYSIAVSAPVATTGSVTALGTSNNLSGVIVTNGGMYVPGDATIGGTTVAATLNVTTQSASNLVVTGNNFHEWTGPTNPIVVKNFFPAKYYASVSTNLFFSGISGVTNGSVWEASLTLKNSSGSDFSVVLPSEWSLFGQTSTNWLTSTNGKQIVLAVKVSTNAIAITNCAVGFQQ